MSDATTLIGQSLIAKGMETDVTTNQGDDYLAGEEEAVITQEEELLMSGELTSEEEKMEQQMLTVALVNSVVETSGRQSPPKAEPVKPEQRYSLRKRRRSGVPQEDQGAQASRTATSSSKIPKRSIKAEAVPACTAVSSAPLPVPLAVTSPKTSSLPLALQPPVRRHAPAMSSPKATKPGPSRFTGAKSTKGKPKRITPQARVLVASKPLTHDPTPMGVPNPLSNPLPSSSTVLSSDAPVQALIPSLGDPSPAQTFTAGTQLNVPCPLPPSSFPIEIQQNTDHVVKLEPETIPEKKKVTIAPDLPPSRGRIFSIDLDPASLDFSVLDSGESGTPAPASADLPLVTGVGRDRAFSFECFAFGINADEPLPPMGERESDLQQQQFLPRPRGDSIIFDPVSFQEGGIHEEKGLRTRESRGISIDLNPNEDILPSANPVQSDEVVAHSYALPQLSMGTTTPPFTSQPTSKPSGRPIPHTASSLDNSPSSLSMAIAPPAAHGHHHYAPLPPHGHRGTTYQHVPPSVVPSNPLGPADRGHVSIIGSCASSTTLQMELLNKDGRIGIYLPEARKERIARFHAKRKMRIWRKRIKYDCRKKLADSRPRIKGRFVKRTDND